MRGVSGGERKRVSIGNEVIINPSLLLLDEPTSGLDSTTALRTIQMLHDIAEVCLFVCSDNLYLCFDCCLNLEENVFGSGRENRDHNDTSALK